MKTETKWSILFNSFLFSAEFEVEFSIFFLSFKKAHTSRPSNKCNSFFYVSGNIYWTSLKTNICTHFPAHKIIKIEFEEKQLESI